MFAKHFAWSDTDVIIIWVSLLAVMTFGGLP